jgi:riboflavin kinase/FMN adenylyltransferase
MDVFAGHRRVDRALRRPALALGNFDGVHLGHQRLIARARAAAARLGGEAMVMTFDPHPSRVLAPSRPMRLLCTTARKLELFASAGADACVVEPFDHALAAMTPEAFVGDILVGALGARHVVVGYNFAFGKNRAGTADTLRAIGAERGFAVEVVDPVSVGEVVVSSSRVRELIEAGEVAGARALLGRDFDVDGVVVRGAGRGRGIGVPTANLDLETETVPALGIYAGRVEVGDERHAAAVSVGTNPTFESSGRLSLEAHLLDFDRDIYGHRLRVAFVERLRGEVRFAGAEDLVEQIRRDIADTRRVLESAE